MPTTSAWRRLVNFIGAGWASSWRTPVAPSTTPTTKTIPSTRLRFITPPWPSVHNAGCDSHPVSRAGHLSDYVLRVRCRLTRSREPKLTIYKPSRGTLFREAQIADDSSLSFSFRRPNAHWPDHIGCAGV